MKDHSQDPLACLIAAKPAFGISDEAEWLTELTNQALPLGSVNWLEVGAGDGRHLIQQLERLSSGRQIRAVALEPSNSANPPALPPIRWLRARVEDYVPDCQFDWINMRHSAYYITDALGQIDRLSACLADHGSIAVTHWSRDCVLYRLHVAITGTTPEGAAAGIEDLAAALAATGRLLISTIKYHDAELLVERMAADATIGAAVFELARRARVSALPAGTDRVAFATEVIRAASCARVRRNGVVLIRRRCG